MSIPSHMKAVVLEEYNKSYQIKTVPTPQHVGPYDLLVKITAASFCHTELMVADGEFKSPLPIIPSHEPVGIVIKAGNKVTKFKPGDHVGSICSYGMCEKCPDCVRGMFVYCTKKKSVGITMNGGMSEYALLDSRSSAKIPDSLPAEKAAPLMCAGATIYQAIKKAAACGLPKGGVVGIFGLGGLGHLGTQFAKALGYRVVAIDVKDAPLELVKSHRLKPDMTINLAKEKPFDASKRITRELRSHENIPFDGLDAAIVATDPVGAFVGAIDLLSRHGLLVVVGQPKDPIPIRYIDVIFKDIRVVGSLLCEADVMQEMLDLTAAERVEIKTKSFKMDDVNDLVDAYHKGTYGGKLVVKL